MRIAIVEDDARIRAHLAALIDESEGYEAVAICATGEDALERIPAIQPDLVFMDINLPGISGVECTRRLKEAAPALQIVMLTVYDDSDQIFRALEMGATGYLLKRSTSEEILHAINEVRRGGAPMSSHIARKVVQSFQRRGRESDASNLAPREEEVLGYVARGYLNKEVAEAMGISLETVRSYLKSIYTKLHVRSRTAAAMKYFRSSARD
jgi:DNA-binding NarL/FixJ family response regulator